MWDLPLLGLAALLAVAHIGARLAGWDRAAFWLKPLPIALFVLVAATAATPVSPLYRALILAGLLFSMIGDILLASGETRFVPGLVAFLIAHLFYAGAFLTQRQPGGPWWLAGLALEEREARERRVARVEGSQRLEVVPREHPPRR